MFHVAEVLSRPTPYIIRNKSRSFYSPCSAKMEDIRRKGNPHRFPLVRTLSRQKAGNPRSETPLQEYEYQVLPTNNHIRRLILEPGKGQDPLVCRLETIKVKHASSITEYEAISYVWGSSVRDQPLIVDGKLIRITVNLTDVLRQCRLPSRSRALWADSVCINQQDNPEKGRQVALMGDIYRNAQRTLICLGTNSEHEDTARNVDGLIREVDDSIMNSLSDPEFPWGWGSIPILEKDSPLVRTARWESWNLLLGHPWFERGWVVQEAALAPEAFILWAGVEINWLMFLRVYLRRNLTSQLNAGTRAIPRLHLRSLQLQRPAEYQALLPRGAFFESVNILEILSAAHKTMTVSNPHDSLYAYLNLPGALEARLEVRPDYDQPCSAMFKAFAVEYLKKTSDLNMLCFVAHNHKSLEESSVGTWIPSWDGTRPCYYYHNVRESILPFPTSVAGSQKAESPQFTISANNAMLQVRGLLVDSVKFASTTLAGDGDRVADFERRLALLWRQLQSYSGRRPPLTALYGEKASLALISTLSCNQVGHGDSNEWVKAINAYARLLELGLLRVSDRDEITPRQLEWSSGAGLALPNMSKSRFEKALRLFVRDRKFVVLGRGYYGMAPPAVQEGDLCAIISGTSTPFILRQVARETRIGGYYKLIGAARIFGKSWENVGGFPVLDLWGEEVFREWGYFDMKEEDISLC